MPWTDESTDLLKSLWSGDYSLAEITKKIGKISQKALLAKANDLGLDPSKVANLKVKSSRQKKRTKKEERGYQLCELSEHMCKWPEGDPKDKVNFYFCGDACYEALPYCPEHAFVAYHSVTKKKLQKDGVDTDFIKDKRRKKSA